MRKDWGCKRNTLNIRNLATVLFKSLTQHKQVSIY